MATASDKRAQQGRDDIKLAVVGDTRHDFVHNGDEHSHTYDVLNEVTAGRKVNNPKSNDGAGDSAGKMSSRSGVTTPRWLIILAVLLFTALISALTGVTVYFVTTSKTNNEDSPAKDQDMTEIIGRLEALQEKHNTIYKKQVAFDTVVQTVQKKQDAFDDVVQTVQKKQAAFDNVVHDRGSTYIRWGKSGCSGNGTELVYSGYAGGGSYEHTGAASSYLCLPEDPQWGKYDDRKQDVGGLVYGAEYEFEYRKLFPNAKLDDNDVPCSVCRSPRANVLMISGRNACYGNWTIEYRGYLMAGHYSHAAASDFVCLDEHPESVTGGAANHNGKLFYFVEGRCGSLPCPPYVDGRELTCVVCST